jgi:hypothetical protein
MSDIPGYREAIERERDLRAVAYLDLPEIVCGERVRNITPRLLTVLTVFKSPFIIGGPVDPTHIAQFIWACHVEYDPKNRRRRNQVCNRVADIPFLRAREEVDEFTAATFMDSPDGPETIPIASSAAWLIYRFRRDPFRQPEHITMDIPLRKLYQELRCDDKYNGAIVTNKSHKIRGDYLDAMNTPELIAERQKIAAERKKAEEAERKRLEAENGNANR